MKKILFGGLLAKWDEDNQTFIAAEGSPSVKLEQKDVNHVEEDIITFTGVYPGYTKTTLTLYNKIDKDGNSNFDFWTTSEFSGYGCRFFITAQDNIIGGFGISPFVDKTNTYLVRPVLVK